MHTSAIQLSETAPLLIGLDEAAKRLSVSERTVRAMVKRGELPHVPIGRRVLFDPTDLAAWVQARKIRPVTGLASPSGTARREIPRNGKAYDTHRE